MAERAATSTRPQRSRKNTRRTSGLFLGPALFLLILALPTGLEPAAHRLAAVFSLVVIYWVTEAIPLPATALLGPTLAVVLGVADAKAAFASFGHPIILLFLGSFIIARAMALHGLDRRIALFVLSRAWVGKSPGRILLAFGGIGAFLSMWMSNTATTAMMLPIGLGVIRSLVPSGRGGQARGSYATGLMLMIAYSCEIGGIATPVGTPPNLIAIGMIERVLGTEISFLKWMILGVPVSLACFGIAYLLISRLFPAAGLDLAGALGAVRRERSGLGPLGKGEMGALAAFCAAVAMWILPGLVSLILGEESPLAAGLSGALPEAAAAMLAAIVLFVLPVSWPERRFVMTWQEAVKIDWGTILLFGGGLSMGGLTFQTGLAGALGEGLGSMSGLLPAGLAVLGAVLIADLLTEFMSNTATANILVPIFLALGAGMTGSPLALALGVTIGCSIAFSLPVATPPNAIVYGSGHVPLTAMIKAGILADLGCALAAWIVLMLLAGIF